MPRESTLVPIALAACLADRVAAYQYRPRDTVSAISWATEAGAQVSFSGGLIANIQRFAVGNSPSCPKSSRERGLSDARSPSSVARLGLAVDRALSRHLAALKTTSPARNTRWATSPQESAIRPASYTRSAATATPPAAPAGTPGC